MRNFFLTLLLPLAAGVSALTHAGEITVLSAVVKDKTIADAQVTWQRNGESSLQGVTSGSGTLSVPDGMTDDGNTNMIITKPGYSTLVVKCPCDGFTYALSPVMTNLDGLRVVLTWGKPPKISTPI